LLIYFLCSIRGAFYSPKAQKYSGNILHYQTTSKKITGIVNDNDKIAHFDAITFILPEAGIRTELVEVLKEKGRYRLLRYTSFI
jgi:hypothetical protein